MTLGNKGQELLEDGRFIDAIRWFLTNGGDPTLELVMPTAVYGGCLLAMFIFSKSLIMPLVIAIILGGVILATFPSNALTLVVLGLLFVLAAAGQLLTWRGRK